MSIHHQDEHVTLHHGDCLEILRTLPNESVHAVVTDPPYGLSNTTPEQIAQCLKEWASGNTAFVPAKRGGFMGKDWDSFVPPPAVWEECYRVLKPGGHLLAFAGSRTQDLMGMSVRMAGFDIRDSFAWISSATFPKSLDVSKAIDKHLGAEREVIGTDKREANSSWLGTNDGKASTWGIGSGDVTATASPEAQQWEGWGTGLKPIVEPVVMARKPFTGTVAANVLEHGTGALNIDASRIGTEVRVNHPASNGSVVGLGAEGSMRGEAGGRTAVGRHPANILLDESAADEIDTQAGRPVSRFFYCAKAPREERPRVGGVIHPTVKPLTLMRYLVRMVTPPGGVVLDPFAGSGTTLQAAREEGFTSIGVEAHPDYLPLIAHRLERTAEPQETQPPLPDTAA